MTRTLTATAALAFCLILSGCIIHERGPRHRHQHSSARRGCHPSQYWDGHKCRHKGKGHGARKHDGRRR